MPTFRTTPPDGYSKDREITLEVYEKQGRPPGALLTDGTYKIWCSSSDVARQEILNRLSPPAEPREANGST